MPTPVTIVRPKSSWAEFVGGIVAFLITGVLLMWLAPIATEGAWRPGYVQSLIIIGLIQMVFRDTSYLRWTRS